ncbi:MAG: PD40 domain-containing protein [Flavobacteriales bacterium]|nr:PD40 domain-containing protein [Flavobacteriales bacterium]
MKQLITLQTCKALFGLSLILLGTFAYSQDGLSDAPKSFRDLFTEGGYHMEYESFNLAVAVYLEAEKMEPDNGNIQYRIGYCHVRSADNKADAIPYLLKAIPRVNRNYDDLSFTEKNAPPRTYYELARAYQLSDQLDSAINNYNQYSGMLNKKHYMQEKVAKLLEQCRYAKELMANPINVKITNLGEGLNTKYSEYTPVITADESMMIFTSRRKGSTGGDENLEFDNRYFEDIYITNFEDDKWTDPEKITGGINTNDHDAVISLSADGQKLYTYSTDGGGDISLSFKMGDDWTAPDRLGPTINTEAKETHVSITPDGKRLYFSSDRGDKKTIQYGGLDLYVSTKLPNGEWSEATNLGDVINTDGDEDAPFIHPNGKRLYFSSKGLKTMGGYDIFYSDLIDGTWTTPVNLGYPINTTKDDIYYVETPDGKRAYYSSVNAELGYGRSDLYMVEMPEKEEVKLTMLTGVMEVQMEDGIALESKIIVKDPASGEETVYTPNAATGEYLIILPPGAEYEVSYTVEDSVIVEEKVDLESQVGYKEFVKTISAAGKIETIEIESEPMIETVVILKQRLLLLDAKVGDTLRIGEMNEEGIFIFESLPDKGNFIFQLDPTEGDMVGKDVRIYRTLDGKQTMLTLDNKGDGSFMIPSEEPVAVVNTVVEVDPVVEPVVEADPVVESVVDPADVTPAKVAVSPFEQNFGYNVKLIKTESAEYKKMIEELASNAKGGYDQVVSIQASASKVPTTRYSTNENLAKERGNKTEWVISRSLKNKGATLEKIKFVIDPNVQGPEYVTDAIENREVYKKYQYVKISTK